jgi:hypothetical protein
MDLPKDFDDRHWWILVSIAGTLIATASAPVKFLPGLVIGLGLLSAGVGQWIGRPVVTSRKDGIITTMHPWRPNVLGIILTVIGIGIIAIGMVTVLGTK